MGTVFAAGLALIDLVLILLVARRMRQSAQVPAAPAGMPWLPPGARVAEFEAVDITGAPVSLSRLRGQTVLVGIFSTHCVPCEEQVPVFALYAEKLGRDRSVAVIVGGNGRSDDFVAALTGKATVALDGPSGPIVTAFSARAFPGIYLLDPDATVLASGPGMGAVSHALAGLPMAGR